MYRFTTSPARSRGVRPEVLRHGIMYVYRIQARISQHSSSSSVVCRLYKDPHGKPEHIDQARNYVCFEVQTNYLMLKVSRQSTVGIERNRKTIAT